MKIPSLLLRRRYNFSRVLWVTIAIYLFFLFVGLIAISVSPASSKMPNLQKLLNWNYVLNQVFSVAFFTVFYFLILNMFYRLIAGKHKPVQFIPVVLFAYVLLAFY